MMELGREGERLAKSLISAVERLATANERIVDLATQQSEGITVEAQAPICPSCGISNPEIRTSAAQGLLTEFILVGECLSCGEKVFGIPIGWANITNDVRDISVGIARERVG